MVSKNVLEILYSVKKCVVHSLSVLFQVATHLNMIEEAAELYAKCGRYDQLNLLHQACGQWEQAVEVPVEEFGFAEGLDRVMIDESLCQKTNFAAAAEEAQSQVKDGEVSVKGPPETAGGSARRELTAEEQDPHAQLSAPISDEEDSDSDSDSSAASSSSSS